MSINIQQRFLPVPGEDGNFPLYNTLKMFNQEWMREMTQKYGLIWQTKTIAGQCVYINDYELVRRLHQEDSDLLEQFFLQNTAELLGPESFISTKKHKEMRNLFNPLFAQKKMAQNVGNVRDVVDRALEKFLSQEGNVVQVYELSQWYVAKVFEVILFGEQLGEKQSRDFLQTGWDLTRGAVNPFSINLPFFPYGKAIRARKQLLAQLYDRIECVKESSLLDAFLKAKDSNGKNFEKQTIEDIMLNLIVAGLVTTTDMLTRIFYFISLHPQVTQRLRQEIDNINLQTCDAKNLSNLNYLDAIIKESFRLNTVVPQVIRKSKTEIYYKNFIIPKNAIIFLQYQYIFMNDERFAGMKGEMAPEKFFPDRWFKPIAQEKGGTFFPYGMGARICLGMHLADLEMKMMLMNIVQKYEWQMVKDSSEWIGGAVKRPKDGLPTRFRYRVKKQVSSQNRRVSSGLYMKTGSIKTTFLRQHMNL